MNKTILAAVLAASMLGVPTAYAQTKGTLTLTPQQRQAQEAWWSARAHKTGQKMAACMAMPDCCNRGMMPATPTTKG